VLTLVAKMEFASKYVYHYSDSDEETISEGELETGMDFESTG